MSFICIYKKIVGLCFHVCAIWYGGKKTSKNSFLLRSSQTAYTSAVWNSLGWGTWKTCFAAEFRLFFFPSILQELMCPLCVLAGSAGMNEYGGSRTRLDVQPARHWMRPSALKPTLMRSVQLSKPCPVPRGRTASRKTALVFLRILVGALLSKSTVLSRLLGLNLRAIFHMDVEQRCLKTKQQNIQTNHSTFCHSSLALLASPGKMPQE